MSKDGIITKSPIRSSLRLKDKSYINYKLKVKLH